MKDESNTDTIPVYTAKDGVLIGPWSFQISDTPEVRVLIAAGLRPYMIGSRIDMWVEKAGYPREAGGTSPDQFGTTYSHFRWIPEPIFSLLTRIDRARDAAIVNMLRECMAAGKVTDNARALAAALILVNENENP